MYLLFLGILNFPWGNVFMVSTVNAVAHRPPMRLVPGIDGQYISIGAGTEGI